MKYLSAPLALLLAATPASAAIVLSGDFINGTTTPTLTITEDITFTIAVDGDVGIIAFEDWGATDTSASATGSNPPQDFAYEKNEIAGTVPLYYLLDAATATVGDLVGADDGFMVFNSFPAVAGDVVTIKAGSYTFAPHETFNPALAGIIFTGNVVLADSGANILSDSVAVPEPSAALLCALGLLPLLRRKR